MSDSEIVCEDLNLAIDRLRGEGYRLDLIYPADEPHSALLSNGAGAVRVTTRPGARPPGDDLPTFVPEFVLTRAGASPAQGRAGMLYRDLIPSRLGGRYIASHIAIPEGGPVADWVHYHRIALQLIYVRRGWVRVAYDGQGDAFVMHQGDLVLQPPEIRHRVLESSDGLEVVEITAPALHATFADHELELPSGDHADRTYSGQHFVFHVAAETPWTPFNGGEAQETAIAHATGGLAEVRTIRPGEAPRIDFPAHNGELAFGFVLDGAARFHFREHFALKPGDAFVMPPGESWSAEPLSGDFRLLHVTTSSLDPR